jgi:hypothetical protein
MLRISSHEVAKKSASDSLGLFRFNRAVESPSNLIAFIPIFFAPTISVRSISPIWIASSGLHSNCSRIVEKAFGCGLETEVSSLKLKASKK